VAGARDLNNAKTLINTKKGVEILAEIVARRLMSPTVRSAGRRHLNLDDGSVLADNGLGDSAGSDPRTHITAPFDWRFSYDTERFSQ
jgi:hypothetical protein